MTTIFSALNGEYQPGLYRVSSGMNLSELVNLCQQQEWQLFYLDGTTISNKAEFLEHFAVAMDFPEYFGYNWDAFEECLKDLDEASGDRYILLYEKPENFAQNDPAEWQTALEILQEAVESLQLTNASMYVLFKTDSSFLNNLELL